jgi:tetratricopeptide (TPR) repeat protein
MPPLFPDLPEIAEAVTNPRAEDYAAAANYALKRRKRPLAVQQVAAAIALDPHNLRYLQLLSDIVGTTPDPLGLLRLTPQGTFYGVAAARAWMLAKQKRSTEATRLLSEVVQFRPNAPFIPWLHHWGERFGWLQRVTPDVMADLLRSLLRELGAQGVNAGGEVNLDSALAIAEELQKVHPEHVGLRAARMWCHRLLSEPSAALELMVKKPIAWQTELERALAHRALGQNEDELKALRSAVALAPSESSIYRELAKALVLQCRRDAAEEVLIQANAQAPTSWSLAALAYLQWLDRGQTLPAVTDDAEAQAFLRDTRCYRDLLPDPCDVTVGVVRSALTRAREPRAPERIEAKAHVSHRPAPSARLAFNLGLTALNKKGHLSLVGVAEATALGELWILEQDTLLPQLPPATPRVLAAIKQLVATRFEWSRWFQAAKHIATHDLATEDSRDVLSVALYPPPAPASADSVQWLTHVHAAVAILLGLLDNDAQRSRGEIERCLSATDDWICIVGILALYTSVKNGSRTPAEVRAVLESLLTRSKGQPSYSRALAVVGTLILTGAQADAFKDLRAQLVFSGTVAPD